MAAGQELGTYYTIPVILSFDGIEKSVNSKLSKAFGDVGKKSGKALADATEADVKKSIDAYAKLRDKASDALGKIRVEEEKLAKARAGGKTDQIVAAEERLNKARRDSDSANRAALSSYRDLETAQDKLKTKSGGLGLELGKLGNLAGTAGQALATAGVVAAGAALAGITALTAGVVVAGRALYDLGAQWDDVADGIAVRTGTLGPELDKLTNSIKAIAPSTASSIGEIGNVVGAVSQSLRVSGQDLEVISRNIADLNRLTGEQLNIRDLGKVFRGFGIDAKAQVPALDSLYRVSTATGIGVNDLIASIGKAGPAARLMGMDLGETAALLATFQDAGVDADAALKSLGLAAKALAKDGKEPAEGLRETITEIDRLLAIGSEPEAINLATKIFGKGYLPILDSIRSGALDAQALDRALIDGGVTIRDVADATADWSERWQQLKNTLSVALEPLASGVFNIINAKLDSLSDWVTNNQSKVIGFFAQLSDFAFNAAKSIVQFAADSLRALAELIRNVSGALRPVFDAMQSIGSVAKFIPGFSAIGDSMEKIGKAGQTIDGAFAKVPGYLDNAAGALEDKVIPALGQGQTYVQKFLERTQQATRFTEVLGDSIASINDNGDIVLSDNTPEVVEKLEDLGLSVKELPDGMFTVEADTEEGEKILGAFVDQWNGTPIEPEVKPNTGPADTVIEEWRRRIAGDGVQIPITGGLVGVPVPGGGPLSDGPLGVPRRFAPGRGGGTGPEKGLTENSVTAKRAIESNFPAIETIGGYRPTDVTPFGTFNEHSSGEAIDVMVPNWSSPAGKAYGDQIAQWALANADALGTEWVIWQQKTFYPDGRVVNMNDRGNPTQNHYDHVHLKTKSGAVPSSMRRFSGSRGGAARSPMMNTAAPMSMGGQGGPMNIQEPTAATMSSAIDTSGLYGASPDLVNAYGAGYQPGIGTPGVNEYGEPGYYQPDEKAVRDGRQRVADAEESIKQANAAVAQAEARRSEMPIDAEQSSVLSADESVRSAKVRAEKAIRERDDAMADLANTQKGQFTKAREASNGSRGSGGGASGGMGELGSIASSFLTETFGLPDLSNFMPLQMMNTVLGAFDWRTMGMSNEEKAAYAAQGGTSSAPFGIPDIAAPPMPTNGQHGAGGGGAPGPSIINVDQSQNFNNSPLGWDPAKTEKERNNNINRAPRLPVGMGS